MDMSLSKLWEMVRTGKPGMLQCLGSQTVGQDWVTEQQKWHQSLQLKKKKIIHLARRSIWSETGSHGLGWAHVCVSGKNWAYWLLGLWPVFFFTWPINFQSTSLHPFPWQPQGPSAVRKGESWCSGAALRVSLAPSFLTSYLVKWSHVTKSNSMRGKTIDERLCSHIEGIRLQREKQ